MLFWWKEETILLSWHFWFHFYYFLGLNTSQYWSNGFSNKRVLINRFAVRDLFFWFRNILKIHLLKLGKPAVRPHSWLIRRQCRSESTCLLILHNEVWHHESVHLTLFLCLRSCRLDHCARNIHLAFRNVLCGFFFDTDKFGCSMRIGNRPFASDFSLIIFFHISAPRCEKFGCASNYQATSRSSLILTFFAPGVA